MSTFLRRGAAGVRVRSWRVGVRWDGWGTGLRLGRVGHLTIGRTS